MGGKGRAALTDPPPLTRDSRHFVCSLWDALYTSVMRKKEKEMCRLTIHGIIAANLMRRVWPSTSQSANTKWTLC